MVVGAGRGPLVAASLRAGTRAKRHLRVYAGGRREVGGGGCSMPACEGMPKWVKLWSVVVPLVAAQGAV